ncbi:MAG: hypothetical protein IKJ01_09265 [Lachnospiraceae bacterium]|nr:hypothetical protein [Lachnospiraceae bacterium]
MKEQLHTIPISDAMENAGECPFCYIERRTEEHALNYVLGHGASYMEADIRAMTDKEGFCRTHFKKMFDYGNSLGNAWILKTHYRKMIDEMNQEFKNFKPGKPPKRGLFSKPVTTSANSIADWIHKKEESCFVCNNVKRTFDAYLKTFFNMYKKDSAFRNQVMETKGVCLSHFAVMIEGADTYLSASELEEFYNKFLPLMSENMERIYEDVAWFIEKYDYKNRDADWKTSRDAIQRGMQKLKGTDSSLPPYQLKK